MRSKGHGEDPSKSEQVETRYRVLARTISARGRGATLFSERSSRAICVFSRGHASSSSVPFGPGSSRFCSVMEPTISLVTFVIARDISRSDWLEITATSTVVRDGPQTG